MDHSGLTGCFVINVHDMYSATDWLERRLLKIYITVVEAGGELGGGLSLAPPAIWTRGQSFLRKNGDF